MRFFAPLADDPERQVQSAIFGRHLLVFCLLLIVAAWGWQALHDGGSSPLMREIVRRNGPQMAVGPVLIGGVLAFAMFRRWAKVLAGLMWCSQCCVMAYQHALFSRWDLVLTFAGMAGIGFVLALLAKSGAGK